MPVVWSLDLATMTGECWGPPDAVPTLGHNRLPSTGPDVGKFLSEFRKWFVARLDVVCPDLVSFEAPILHKVTQIATTRKLQGLAGVTEMICHEEGIACFEATTSEVKKQLAGHGRAEKEEMIAAARRYGLSPSDDNEADAFGIWLATVRTRFANDYEIVEMWSPRGPLFAGRAA